MKAIILPEAGGIDTLTYADIEKPTPKAGEILVQTKALGLNPMDVYIRSSAPLLTSFLGEARPAILGWDVAGEVAEVGPGVTGFAVGDPVLALTQGKGYAAYVAVEARLAVRKPDNISFDEAAGVPVAGITAWQALVQVGQLRAGQTVLIQAGAGGVGHFAIQMAKHLGATVAATASGRNQAFLRELGADQAIDYTREQFEQVLAGVDLVVDTLGGDTLLRSLDAVKPGGRIVSIVPPLPEAAQQKAQARGITLALLIGEGSAEGMAALAELLRTGAIRTHVSAVYPFTEMKAAHTAIETGRTVGKIVVEL